MSIWVPKNAEFYADSKSEDKTEKKTLHVQKTRYDKETVFFIV